MKLCNRKNSQVIESSYFETVILGYLLLTEYWNRGIMTRVVEEICQIAFDKLELIRITANVYEPNIASARVLEKNGFILEGRMRKAVKKADRIYDVCIYGKVR
ncbi:MAG: GNAT family protein [Lachnospiraceae bacterium]|nr:GNAT family protein [Lachnospiraceae bacterium]MDY4096020.1 GNAT family protein [Lachnospiraceae bacterium]